MVEWDLFEACLDWMLAGLYFLEISIYFRPGSVFYFTTDAVPSLRYLDLTALTTSMAIFGVRLGQYRRLERPHRPTFTSVFHLVCTKLASTWSATSIPPRRDIFSADFMTRICRLTADCFDSNFYLSHPNLRF